MNRIFAQVLLCTLGTSSLASDFAYQDVAKGCNAYLPTFRTVTYQYSGPCDRGLASGSGTIQAESNGDHFFTAEVVFERGLLKNRIAITFYSGTKIEAIVSQGRWTEGTKVVERRYRYSGGLDLFVEHGQGNMRYDNGDWYIGGFERGLMSGFGVLKTGEFSYSGQFLYDTFNGPGRYEGIYFGRPVTLEGNFIDSRFGSFGTLRVEDREYTGPFQNGLPHGEGSIKYKNFSYSGGVSTLLSGSKERPIFTFLEQGVGALTSDDQSIRLSGQFINGKLTGRATGRVKDVNIDALFINGEPVHGTMELPGKAIYRGEIRNWHPNGRGELTFVSPGSNMDGAKLVGGFTSFFSCVGYCFTHLRSGIIAGSLHDSSGKPIAGTTVRVDSGAEEYYAIQRNIDSGFQSAARIISDQTKAFERIVSSPTMLNQTSPVTIVSPTGSVMGRGSVWTTEQPGMLNGGAFIKLK